uniref:Uncharacterized protein n=1 Tax=Octopus bimaculoides TaxID=37653 RepID=A0A0L8I457_OCTBM
MAGAEKTFLDIRVMHLSTPTYINKNLPWVYAAHEWKKRCYNDLVLQIENSSFTPIVRSTSGGTEQTNKH